MQPTSAPLNYLLLTSIVYNPFNTRQQLGNISFSIWVKVLSSVVFMYKYWMPCSEVREAFSYTSLLALFWSLCSIDGPTGWLFANIREHTPNTPFLRCQADCIIHSPMSILMVSVCTLSDELFQTPLISIYKASHTILIWFICTQWIGIWKQQYIPPLPPKVCSMIDKRRKDEQAWQEKFFYI